MGVQVVVGDVNADDLPDVVIANKRITAVLLHEVQYVDSAAWEAAQPQPTR